MTNNNMNYNDRTDRTVTEAKAERRRQRRQKTLPILITGICAMALIAGASVGGVALIKNINPAKNATQSIFSEQQYRQGSGSHQSDRGSQGNGSTQAADQRHL